MPNITIGLIGFARSGKDEFARALRSQHKFRRFALADNVRAAALALDPVVVVQDEPRITARLSFVVEDQGWESAKALPDVRRLLQRIGTDVVRNLVGDNVWIDLLARQIAEQRESDPGLRAVVTDVRFQNEVDWILDQGGAIVRIVRPGVGPVNGHVSDNALSSVSPHYEVVNDGDIHDLWAMAYDVAQEIITTWHEGSTPARSA